MQVVLARRDEELRHALHTARQHQHAASRAAAEVRSDACRNVRTRPPHLTHGQAEDLREAESEQARRIAALRRECDELQRRARRAAETTTTLDTTA